MTAINKFNKSMVYRIRSPNTDKYYIGSTTQILCKRFVDHKMKYKQYEMGKGNYITSFKIIELGDAYIELLEEVNCENRNQLEKKEGELIREHKVNCVNKYIAGRTHKQWEKDNVEHRKQYIKKWGKDHSEHMKQCKKQYFIDNREKRSVQQKEYNLVNKETIKEKQREYNLINRDKINEKARLRYAEKKLLKDLKTITI